MKAFKTYLQEGLLDMDDEQLDKGTENVAIMEWIEKYLKPHNPYSQFVITPNNTISMDVKRRSIKIVFDGFDELPEYINFESDIMSTVIIECRRGSHIKSFRGLPTKAKEMTVHAGYNSGEAGIKGKMPDWSIEIDKKFRFFASAVQSFGKFNIKCGDMTTIKIDTKVESLKGLKITGKNIILDFVNDFNMGDKISKLLNRKAPMNKYRGQFVEPITEAGLDAITTFFKGIVDLKNVYKIGYTQASCLERHNGKFYRCKNW